MRKTFYNGLRFSAVSHSNQRIYLHQSLSNQCPKFKATSHLRVEVEAVLALKDMVTREVLKADHNGEANHIEVVTIGNRLKRKKMMKTQNGWILILRRKPVVSLVEPLQMRIS